MTRRGSWQDHFSADTCAALLSATHEPSALVRTHSVFVQVPVRVRRVIPSTVQSTIRARWNESHQHAPPCDGAPLVATFALGRRHLAQPLILTMTPEFAHFCTSFPLCPSAPRHMRPFWPLLLYMPKFAVGRVFLTCHCSNPPFILPRPFTLAARLQRSVELFVDSKAPCMYA